MDFYFDINEILDHIANSGDNDMAWHLMAPVHLDIPGCHGHSEDAFMLSRKVNILNLNSAKAPAQLADLIKKVSLYHINMEMMLDDALTERHNNETLKKALQRAFDDRPLPNTLHNTAGQDPESLGGSLHHPMLDHIDDEEMCRIYLGFIKALGTDNRVYNFADAILGKHEEKFLDIYDGFIHGERGMIRADILVMDGRRKDHEERDPQANYIENGRRIAEDMGLSDVHEIIWAWLEADHYQMRRCREIHRLMTMPGLPKIPSWVRTDTLALLEKEATKQRLAEMLIEKDPKLAVLGRTPAIKKGLQASTKGQVDDLLQQLLSQTLNPDAGYSGTAGKFAEAASQREKEAHLARLS